MSIKRFASRSLAIGIGVITVVLVLSGIGLRTLKAQGPRQRFIYTVKFTCVPEVGPAQAVGVQAPFEPALYRTAINVHNFMDETVTFTKRAVLTNSEDQPRGTITGRVNESLTPDQALSVDCLDVQQLFGGTPQPVGDGFLVIESAVELDVAAVYTALIITAGSQREDTGAGLGVDVEYIQPKVLRR
jgi:hypothetical protein